MKKHVLALLIAAAAAPISATAAPQFYGKFNLSVDKTADYPAVGVDDVLSDITAAPGLSDQWQVESNSSRLGVRGSEPLYNKDLKAIYQFEAGADVDGDSAATFSTRNSYLGLDTKLGKFYAGRYDSVVKQAQGKNDRFNDTIADIENLFLGERRLSNTLNWVSPDFGGMVFKVQMAPGEGDAVGTEVKDGITDVLGASVEFNQDALFAALAIEQNYFEADFGGGADIIDTQTVRGSVGVALDGGLELGAIVEMVKLDPNAAGSDTADVMSWMVSGKLQAGERLALKAQAGVLDSSDLDAEVSVITAGADYALGKQTTLYGLISISDVDAFNLVDETGNAISAGMVHSF